MNTVADPDGVVHRAIEAREMGTFYAMCESWDAMDTIETQYELIHGKYPNRKWRAGDVSQIAVTCLRCAGLLAR